MADEPLGGQSASPVVATPTVSLCMIVKNEERWLERCLSSISGVVDQIILVDSQSEDGTLAIAADFGAFVVQHTWQSDFSLARNTGLEHATGDWILVLDADERLDPATAQRLKASVATTSADAIQLCQRSFLPPGELASYDDLHITRLFRNLPGYRYERPTHEQILPAILQHGGKVATSDLTILHYGYAEPTVQGAESRGLRNLRYLDLALADSPEDPYYLYQKGITLKSVGEPRAALDTLTHLLRCDYLALGDGILNKLFMKLSQLALQFDEHQQALRYAREGLARNPDNLVTMYVAALSLLFLGNAPEAYPLFLRIRRHPNSPVASQEDLDTVLEYCRLGVGGTTP